MNGDTLKTLDLLTWFKNMYDLNFAKQKYSPQEVFVEEEEVSLESSREFGMCKCLLFLVFIIDDMIFVIFMTFFLFLFCFVFIDS